MNKDFFYEERMKIIESIEEMQRYSIQLRGKGKTLANVSTTGFLHKGHLHLVDIAKENADEVVLNIDHIDTYRKFKQEPHKYDQYLEEYRTEQLDKDLELCEKHGVNIFFHPDIHEVYTVQAYKVHANIKKLRQAYKGVQFVNPGISKSNIKDFNMMTPDIIMMGQKDIFQNLEAQYMLTDFNYPIKMIMAPIVREPDGVASSSRLKRLSDSERENARSIYQALKEIEEWTSYPSIRDIKEHIRNSIVKGNGSINYIVVCCASSLEELRYIDREAVVAVEAVFGTVSLADNIVIEPK